MTCCGIMAEAVDYASLYLSAEAAFRISFCIAARNRDK
jgi:hypothetical protein